MGDDQRQALLDWAAQGHLPADQLRPAARLAGVIPDEAAWRNFVDRLLLFGAVVLLSAGLVFFLAYNWLAMGRYAKFALAEAGLLAALVCVWRFDLQDNKGKAALLAASLMVGALLALVGQTYQTGASPWELFAIWALAILPWVVVGRYAALWLFWLLLLNLSANLEDSGIARSFGIHTGAGHAWMVFWLNSAALAAWELAAARGVGWLQQRWASRSIATVLAWVISGLAVEDIDNFGRFYGGPNPGIGLLVWVLWLGVLYAAYRRSRRDVYMLATGAVSLLFVSTWTVADWVDGIDKLGESLIISAYLITASAVAARWLRKLASEPAA